MPLPLEAMSTRKRRPNWTDQECIFLAQLMEERKVVIRGKCSTGVSTQDKRQAWEEISQAINAVFPQIQRTVSDCSKKWENLLAKAREEIKRQKMQLGEDSELSLEQFSHITQIVISVMNSESDRLLEDRKDPSIMHMMDTQSFDDDEDDEDEENSHSTGEPSAVVNSVLTDNGHPACSIVSPAIHSTHFSEPSTSPPTTHRFAFTEASSSSAVNFAMPCTTIPTMSGSHLASHCSSTPLQERLDLEMSVLRRQEAVLKLQEEYYTLKIKLMKEEMAEPTRKRLKGEPAALW